MKRTGLIIIPAITSFLFTYSCGGLTPHVDEPTAYKFSFEGTNCNIEYESKYETKIYEGDKDLTFTINPEYDFVLINSDINIVGKNTTYDEATHKITISEVVGDVTITANATTKPTFDFHGSNCNIGGVRDITDMPLKKGDKNVEFIIDVESGYALGKEDLTIEGENVDYDPASHKIIISEVVGPVEITANACALLKFSFTGTNCNIDGNSKILAKEIKKGDKNVTFSVNVEYGYFLDDQKVTIIGKNATYDEETKTITISEVVGDVNIIATADPLTKHTVIGTLANCHYYEDPKEEGYIAGSKVRLKFIPNKSTDAIYGMPTLSDVSLSEGDYTYDQTTGTLTFEMPDTNVSFKATSESEVNILHITSDYTIIEEGTDYRIGHYNSYQINDALRYYNLGELGLSTTGGTDGKEIILTNTRSESAELANSLGENEDYAIKVVENKKIVVGYKTKFARICAIDRLLTDFLYGEDGINVPTNLEVRGACKKEDFITMFKPANRPIRDPYIYRDGTNYYMYGTCGSFDGDRWSVYGAKDTFIGGWKLLNENIVDESTLLEDHTDRWAPELHKYGDNYYLFTTYKGAYDAYLGEEHRGTIILKSESLTEGFKVISRCHSNRVHIQPGRITIDFYTDCGGIDGTLYITEDGKPYLIHVCGYTDGVRPRGLLIVPFKTDPGIEPLSEIDEQANVALVDENAYVPWRRKNEKVFEGPCIRKLKDGRLVMTASSFDPYDKYCVGLVCNKDGEAELTNPNSWVQQKRLLYAKDIYEGAPDGGHGMIFDDPDGNLYFTFHGPNDAGFNNCNANIIPIKEAYGTLVWDLYNHTI